MAASVVVLKSSAGIKRDGTIFEGDFYVDGSWVRFQRGLPRKMWGYRAISLYLPEITRGLNTFVQNQLVYSHSGSSNQINRFTINNSFIPSVVTNRTPVAVGAVGTVTLTGGVAGSVNSVTVNGVTITSGSVAFSVDLATTAAAVAANINAYTSSPNYAATAVGPVIAISPTVGGSASNGFVVAVTLTTITATTTNLAGGSNALVANSNNTWMFDVIFDSVSLDNLLIASVSQNLVAIDSSVAGQIFTGDVLGTDPLVEVQLPENANATGGIVVLHPYLFYYGTAGIVGWSIPGDPRDLTGSGSGQARIAGQKIVKGLPLRAGAGSAPAGLFWAYNALIRSTFTGGATVFQFDTISAETTILSPNSVIEYDGIYYWCGVDRFLMFNGVVRELPNTMNLNFFFDNLNENQTQKVFATKVPRFGEIWWCFPLGDSTECNHAIIFNVRENTWYDTPLPNSGRSAASFVPFFAAPLTTGVTNQSGLGYKVWLQEQGLDEVDGVSINSIVSYFETSDLSLAVLNNQNRKVKISYIEPDFVQEGDMTVEVLGRANARAPTVTSNVVTFVANPGSNPAAQIVPFKEQRREMRVRFTSNTVGGDYQMGQVLMHIEPGDGTITG
jgi:hypothetical protein